MINSLDTLHGKIPVCDALQAGAGSFSGKPFDQYEALLMRLRNMLEAKLMHEAAKRYILVLEQMVNEAGPGPDHFLRPRDAVKIPSGDEPAEVMDELPGFAEETAVEFDKRHIFA